MKTQIKSGLTAALSMADARRGGHVSRGHVSVHRNVGSVHRNVHVNRNIAANRHVNRAVARRAVVGASHARNGFGEDAKRSVSTPA